MGYLGEHKKDILELLIIVLIGVVMYLMVFLTVYKKYIIANWIENESKDGRTS